MKKYLMRAPSGPFDNPTHFDCVDQNLIGSNSGNLLFPHSITRALMTDDAEIDFIGSVKMLEEANTAEINEKYDAFVIPLANAFRESFIPELTALGNLVKKLTIPCIVIGVGFQGKLSDKGKKESYSFNLAVKHFMSAVLEKSSCIGIRGEVTASYLSHLGYKRDKDFMVIGCPSMFLYGTDLPAPRPFTLSPDIKLSVNSKASLPDKLHLFLKDACEKIPDHYYIPQNDYEQKIVLSGLTIHDSNKKMHIYEDYPRDLTHPLYRQNRVRSFASAEAWFEFLRTRDLSIGSRIHGNIAAILSGTPAFIVVPDSRVLELADYHNIAHITLNELPDGADIFKVLEGVDFNRILDGHADRFNVYHEFYRKNDLETIYDDPSYDSSTKTAFDKKIADIDFYGPMIPMPHADYDMMIEGARYLRKRYKAMESLAKETQPQTSKDMARVLAKRIIRKVTGKQI